MKTLKTYIEQINDPIRQQMLNYLAIEIELDRIKLTEKGLDFANIVWEQFI